jgi:transposase
MKTTKQQSKTVINVGVDIGKWTLDICIHEKQLHWQDSNDDEGIRRVLKRLAYYRLERLVLEATGRYEFALVQAAHQKGLPVCIVQPRMIRRYAGATNQLAKTDKLDAALIAEFAARVKPAITPQQSKTLIAIKDLIARRRQLISLRTQETNRRYIMGSALETSCKRIIHHINAEIDRIESRLAKQVEKHGEWTAKQTLLKTTPGVGNTLVYTLLADLPELGSLTHKQIGALVGVAPMNRDSGKFKGKRRVQGGRTHVRTTLYMATLSATQCNPAIKSYYRHLVAKGKHKKVAITACMHKFITILNAMVRDNCVWAY